MQEAQGAACLIFMSNIDALVMGRKTFETVRGLGPWPYGDKPVVVLSHSLVSLPAGTPECVRLSHGEPATWVQTWASQGMQRQSSKTYPFGFVQSRYLVQSVHAP